MIPSNVKNKMTWEQYFIRRGQMVEKVKIDGKEVEVVRSEKMDQVFERFIGEIVSKSNPGADTSNINQEAQKQKR